MSQCVIRWTLQQMAMTATANLKFYGFNHHICVTKHDKTETLNTMLLAQWLENTEDFCN